LWVILAYENQRFIPQNFWFKLLLDTIHTDTQYEIDTVAVDLHYEEGRHYEVDVTFML
jgi:hypothetical protein